MLSGKSKTLVYLLCGKEIFRAECLIGKGEELL
jgi:hypothetical protein